MGGYFLQEILVSRAQEVHILALLKVICSSPSRLVIGSEENSSSKVDQDEQRELFAAL